LEKQKHEVRGREVERLLARRPARDFRLQRVVAGHLLEERPHAARVVAEPAVPAEAAEQLEEQVKAFAEQLIVSNSGQSMALTKKMIAEVQELPFDDGLKYAEGKNAEARATSDCKRGISAFLSKTEIKW